MVFIYKRTTNFKAITDAMRRLSPSKIYIVADGAKTGDEFVCNEARLKLESMINWDCDLQKNYSKVNLGLKLRFSSGIDWVFEHEDRAIFIEDDCIPDPSFFRFCDELLEKYKDDTRIGTISGNNFLFNKAKVKESYYFSRYPLIWGWATWKRVWVGYDPQLNDWKCRGENSWLYDLFSSKIPILYWKIIFDLVKKGEINTWDYQLTYLSLKKNYLNIIPSTNLVTNVGVDKLSTHTKIKSRRIGLKSVPMTFPLRHPDLVKLDKAADKVVFSNVYMTPVVIISLILKTIKKALLSQNKVQNK